MTLKLLLNKALASPPKSVPWYQDPNDLGALARIYAKDAVPAYAYPAFEMKVDDAENSYLVQHSAYTHERFQGFNIQFKILCKHLIALSPDDKSSIEKFRDPLLCGYQNTTSSKYAHQSADTFEEMKLNLEVVLNQIIKNNDKKTLGDVIRAITVCEGGTYAELKRLKESFTEPTSLLAFLEGTRGAIIDDLAQKHIAKVKKNGTPISSSYEAHVSTLFGKVATLAGIPLAKSSLNDVHIPALALEKDNEGNIRQPLNVIFTDMREAEIGSDIYKMSHMDIENIPKDFYEIYTADAIVTSLKNYFDENLLLILNKYHADSRVDRTAVMYDFTKAINELMASYGIIDFDPELFVDYDHENQYKNMSHKPSVIRSHYFYGYALQCLSSHGIVEGLSYQELCNGYSLATDGKREWIVNGKNKSTIVDLHDLINQAMAGGAGADLFNNLVQKITSRAFIKMLTAFSLEHPGKPKAIIFELINRSRALKIQHNESESLMTSPDYIIEDMKDIAWMNSQPQNKLSDTFFHDETRVELLLNVLQNVREDSIPYFITFIKNNSKNLRKYREHSEINLLLAIECTSLQVHWSENLMTGAQKGWGIAVNLLLTKHKSKIDINAQNNNKSTALMMAVENGHGGVAVALIDAGAGLDFKDKKGMTALKFAAEKEYMPIVKALILKGADVNAIQNPGWEAWVGLGMFRWTALMLAVKYGYTEIAKELIRAGADVNICANRGVTALMLAVERGDIEFVNVLINAGASVNITDVQGETPLMIAAQRRYTEIVKILINAHANVNHRNFEGRTALDLLLECPNFFDIEYELVKHGAIYTYNDNISLRFAEHVVIRTPAEVQALSVDTLKKFAYEEYPDLSSPHACAEPFANILIARGATIDYAFLQKHHCIHSLAGFFGLPILCKLANIPLNSDNAIRIYAKVQLSRIESAGDNRSASDIRKIKGFTKIYLAEDGSVRIALEETLAQNYTRRFFSTPRPLADLPQEFNPNQLRIN